VILDREIHLGSSKMGISLDILVWRHPKDVLFVDACNLLELVEEFYYVLGAFWLVAIPLVYELFNGHSLCYKIHTALQLEFLG